MPKLNVHYKAGVIKKQGEGIKERWWWGAGCYSRMIRGSVSKEMVSKATRKRGERGSLLVPRGRAFEAGKASAKVLGWKQIW